MIRGEAISAAKSQSTTGRPPTGLHKKFPLSSARRAWKAFAAESPPSEVARSAAVGPRLAVIMNELQNLRRPGSPRILREKWGRERSNRLGAIGDWSIACCFQISRPLPLV